MGGPWDKGDHPRSSARRRSALPGRGHTDRSPATFRRAVRGFAAVSWPFCHNATLQDDRLSSVTASVTSKKFARNVQSIHGELSSNEQACTQSS